MYWYSQWDGTVKSLDRKSGGHRPRTLSTDEVKHHVLDFVEMMNNEFKPVNYRMVQGNIKASLNRMIPMSTIQRYGKEECGIRSRKSREITARDIDLQHWNDIAKFRRFCQQIGHNRLVFVDKIAIYAIMPPLRTLVAPGHEPLIIVDKPSAYAERYDFIGAINVSQTIASMTLTSLDRKKRHINGIRIEVLNEWITDGLAPAINQLSIHDVYLICDKSRVHNTTDMLQAFDTGEYTSVVDVLCMPTTSAKYVSPMDNPIWHSFRERIRSQYPITTVNLPSILAETFLSLSKQEIKNAYRKCALDRGTNVFFDK